MRGGERKLEERGRYGFRRGLDLAIIIAMVRKGCTLVQGTHSPNDYFERVSL